MNIQPTATIPTGAEPIRNQAARNVQAEASPPPDASITASSATPTLKKKKKTGTNPANNVDVKSAVDKVAAFMKQQAVTDLSFSVDDETNIRVVKVIDRSTQEIIRQIPSEEMLQMAQALDKLQGLLLKQKA